MHEVEQVRMWALLHSASFLCLPLALLGGAFHAATAVVIGASWLRFVYGLVTAPLVRRLGVPRLVLACFTGPLGALWVRRRVRALLPAMTLRPRPRW